MEVFRPWAGKPNRDVALQATRVGRKGRSWPPSSPHRGFHLVLSFLWWMQRCSSPGLQGFQNRRPESTDRNGGLTSLPPPRSIPAPPHRRKGSRSSSHPRHRRCAGRHLSVVLAQLSVCLCCRLSWSNLSVPSVLGWRLFEIPAGCRPPLAFLPSCPSRSRAVVLMLRSSRPSLGKSRKGRRRRRQKRLKNRGTDSPFLHV